MLVNFMVEDNKKNGFIKLYRSMWENPISNKPNYLSVWIYLLSHANHQDKNVIFDNKKTLIKRGSFVGSLLGISKHFNLSIGTVSNILKYLETENQIETKRTTKNTVFTIVKYDEYNKVENTSENKLKTKRKQIETTNKDNKEKKEDNIILQTEVCEEITYEPLEKDKTENKQIFALMAKFKEYNPGIKIEQKTHRNACKELIKIRGYELAKKTVEYALAVQGKEYAPTITTPTQLINKLGDLRVYGERQKQQVPRIVKI